MSTVKSNTIELSDERRLLFDQSEKLFMQEPEEPVADDTIETDTKTDQSNVTLALNETDELSASDGNGDVMLVEENRELTPIDIEKEDHKQMRFL